MSTTRRALHELDKPFTRFRLKLGPQTFTRTPPLSAPLFLPFFLSPIFFIFIPFSHSFSFSPSVSLISFPSWPTDTKLEPCKSVIACRGKGCFDVDTKRGPSSRGNERKRSHLDVRM